MLSLHFTFSVYLRNHTITILDSRVTLFSFSKYKRNTVFSSRNNAILQKYISVSKDKTQCNYIRSSIHFGSSTAIICFLMTRNLSAEFRKRYRHKYVHGYYRVSKGSVDNRRLEHYSCYSTTEYLQSRH